MRFAVASGEKVDRAALKPLPPASFVHLPAGMPHYAMAAVETIVQINGVGPFDVTYIDPKDDPAQPLTQRGAEASDSDPAPATAPWPLTRHSFSAMVGAIRAGKAVDQGA